MTYSPGLPRREPPRIARWLLTLFTPVDEAESMMGDLAEEFSNLVAEPGPSAARNWYWRQTLKTIAYSAGDAFRAAPLLISCIVFGGWWLIGFATRSSVHVTQAFLDSHEVYRSDPSVYLFWLKFPLETGRVILCAVIGASVALIANRREMAAVTMLALLQMVLFLAATVALIANGREWLHWALFMLPWNALSSLATVTGGMIVRKFRASAKLRRSAA